MRHKAFTVFIYGVAAVAASLFWVTRTQDGTWSGALRALLLLFPAPLLFVFAYPRFLFASEARRRRFAAILHGLGAAITTVLFVVLGSAFWKNPLRDADSILLVAVPFIAMPVFLVATLFLLLNNRPTLAKFASFLFWPYWLMLALTFVGRFFEETIFRTVFCFLCFIAPILFAPETTSLQLRLTPWPSDASRPLVSCFDCLL